MKVPMMRKGVERFSCQVVAVEKPLTKVALLVILQVLIIERTKTRFVFVSTQTH